MALQIDLVTPARKILSQSADEVRAPGQERLLGGDDLNTEDAVGH